MKAAQDQGTRALDQLRGGVEAAITALGTGFLRSTPTSNRVLSEKLQSGTLSAQEFYRQLQRMVYRLIFLFTAEERGLLLDPKADAGRAGTLYAVLLDRAAATTGRTPQRDAPRRSVSRPAAGDGSSGRRRAVLNWRCRRWAVICSTTSSSAIWRAARSPIGIFSTRSARWLLSKARACGGWSITRTSARRNGAACIRRCWNCIRF